MSHARLVSLTIERFKSFKDSTQVELAPLTIILGRNNSGKSTLIQSLLLLKQTLKDPRSEVMLSLDGLVDAFSLRELTHGWPERGAGVTSVEGPTVKLTWITRVDVKKTLQRLDSPDAANLANHSGVKWLEDPPESIELETELVVKTREVNGQASINEILLRSPKDAINVRLFEDLLPWWSLEWQGQRAERIHIELEHFIPYLRISRTKLGRRDRQRSWFNAFKVIFEPPLEALKQILTEMHYLGSSRVPPASLYKPATTAPTELGASGEFAAQLLHKRAAERVHFLPPLQIRADGSLDVPSHVEFLPLVEAVNTVMQGLSITTPVRIDEIQDIGFRVKFGDANIGHVGRGLAHLLPVVAQGLIAEPSGGHSIWWTAKTLARYIDECTGFSLIALEEPEAHLHPKVASRLAHWFVSLARTNRQLIVETHSDHLVRRLRGLAARAGSGSELERWLLENVVILTVDQDANGCSSVTTSRLTAEGGVAQVWPADFMDEASDEESAIYYARLDKEDSAEKARGRVELVEGPEPESEEAP